MRARLARARCIRFLFWGGVCQASGRHKKGKKGKSGVQTKVRWGSEGRGREVGDRFVFELLPGNRIQCVGWSFK